MWYHSGTKINKLSAHATWIMSKQAEPKKQGRGADVVYETLNVPNGDYREIQQTDKASTEKSKRELSGGKGNVLCLAYEVVPCLCEVSRDSLN